MKVQIPPHLGLSEASAGLKEEDGVVVLVAAYSMAGFSLFEACCVLQDLLTCQGLSKMHYPSAVAFRLDLCSLKVDLVNLYFYLKKS